jgi:hypothetical protein
MGLYKFFKQNTPIMPLCSKKYHYFKMPLSPALLGFVTGLTAKCRQSFILHSEITSKVGKIGDRARCEKWLSYAKN